MTARALLAEARDDAATIYRLIDADKEAKAMKALRDLCDKLDAYLAQPASEAAEIRTLRNAAVNADARADQLAAERDRWYAAYQQSIDPIVRAKMLEPAPPIVMSAEQYDAARGEPRQGEG